MVVPLVVVENHSSVLPYWLQNAFHDETLVHVDAHADIGWMPHRAFSEIARATPSIIGNYERDGVSYSHDGYFDIGSFLSVALQLGIVRHIYWVVPDTEWFYDANRLRRVLVEQTQGMSVHSSTSVRENAGIYEVLLDVGRLSVCTLHSIPPIEDPVLLDIDLDYFLCGSDAASVTRWVQPDVVVGMLEERCPEVKFATVSISEHGGYTPGPWRCLADVVAGQFANTLRYKNDFPEMYPPQRLRQSASYSDYNRGIAELVRRQHGKALPHLRAAVEVLPDEQGYSYVYALALAGVGRKAEAVDAFARACASPMALPQMWNDYASALSDVGDLEGAQRMLEVAVAREPESATIRTNLGCLLVRRGLVEDAEAQLRIAVTLQPSSVDAVYALASVLTQLGARPEARGLFRVCVDIATSRSEQRLAAVALQRLDRASGRAAVGPG